MTPHRPGGAAELSVGVLLPTRDVIAAGAEVSDVLAFAKLAEDLRFESVWVGDSVVARPRLDPLVTLACVAGGTQRVLLGTAVLIAGLRHPVALAHATATLQELSGGRLLLGVGAGPDYGPSRKEYAALGVPFERRFGRLLEVVEVCRELWTGAEVSHDGEFVTIPRARIAPTPTSVPVLLGSSSARGLRVTAESMDGWLPMPTSVDAFRAGAGSLEEAVLAHRRRPDAPMASPYLTMCLVDDVETGRERALASLEAYYGQPASAVAALSDLFVGAVPEAAEWLRAYASAGAHRVIVRLIGPDPLGQLPSLASAVEILRAAE